MMTTSSRLEPLVGPWGHSGYRMDKLNGSPFDEATADVYNTHDAESRASQAPAGGWLATSANSQQHHQFVHPTKPGTVTVPHPKKDLGKGLVRAIRKQAGLR